MWFIKIWFYKTLKVAGIAFFCIYMYHLNQFEGTLKYAEGASIKKRLEVRNVIFPHKTHSCSLLPGSSAVRGT